MWEQLTVLNKITGVIYKILTNNSDNTTHSHRIVTRRSVKLRLKAMDHGHEFSIFNKQFFDNHVGAHKLFVLIKKKQ